MRVSSNRQSNSKPLATLDPFRNCSLSSSALRSGWSLTVINTFAAAKHHSVATSDGSERSNAKSLITMSNPPSASSMRRFSSCSRRTSRKLLDTNVRRATSVAPEHRKRLEVQPSHDIVARERLDDRIGRDLAWFFCRGELISADQSAICAGDLMDECGSGCNCDMEIFCDAICSAGQEVQENVMNRLRPGDEREQQS